MLTIAYRDLQMRSQSTLHGKARTCLWRNQQVLFVTTDCMRCRLSRQDARRISQADR